MNEIKPRIKNFIRYYNDLEIQSMNLLFGKNTNNNWFTQEELVFANDVDLLNPENLQQAQLDWISSNFE